MSFWDRFKNKRVLPPAADVDTTELPGPSETAFLHSFGLALLGEESARTPDKNALLSPLSIFFALALAENGSLGETKAAIRRVLSLPADSGDAFLNQMADALLKSLPLSGAAELVIANALWLDIASSVSPDFLKICLEVYDAKTQTLDLRLPSSAHTINEWVSTKTGGKIANLVTPKEIAETTAILTNAVYFKAKFSVPFPKDATQPKLFHLVDGREKTVPMMHKAGLAGAYRNGKNFEAAVLPYAGTHIALYLLLPAEGNGPEQILTEDALRQVLARGAPDHLDLSVPRFAVDISVDLRKSLTRLGMGIAFEPSVADFSPLGSPPFCISQVLHKTFLEVDEEGTVATAATATLPVPLSPRKGPETSRTLVFDRPFAIAIMDSSSGAILFLGIVHDPS